MRAHLLSTAVLAALFAGGMAFADETIGTIKSVDEAANTVTLQDGTVYTFENTSGRHEMLGGYLPGDKVAIDWAMRGEVHAATAMSPDFAAGVTGKIKAVDDAASMVTLESGSVYTFQNAKGEKAHLGGFKPGDEVTIVVAKEGGKEIGRSIASHTSADVSGKVKAIDEVERTVTLEDGTIYSFQGEKGKEVHLGGFKVGDMVKIEAVNVGSSHIATAISAANG